MENVSMCINARKRQRDYCLLYAAVDDSSSNGVQ